MTAIQTLEMVHYLVMNIGVVRDGALSFVGLSPFQCIDYCPSNRRVSNG